jgi:hypothetical protein
MQFKELLAWLPMEVRQWAETLRELAKACGEETSRALATRLPRTEGTMSKYLKGDSPKAAYETVVPKLTVPLVPGIARAVPGARKRPAVVAKTASVVSDRVVFTALSFVNGERGSSSVAARLARWPSTSVSHQPETPPRDKTPATLARPRRRHGG